MRVAELARVSVLVPLYNGVELLAGCLASVRAQTHRGWEVLVGVNGHARGSPVHRRAEQLAGDGVRVVHVGEVASAPGALNALAREARHDLVCLLDADDSWLPRKLEEQLAFVARGCDVVGTFCTYFGDRGGGPRLPAGVVPQRAFLDHNPMICSSVLLRRSDVAFREEFLYDYDLWLRLAARGSCFFNVPQALTRHRVHSASAFNSRADGERRRRGLLVRHAGSRLALWLARRAGRGPRSWSEVAA